MARKPRKKYQPKPSSLANLRPPFDGSKPGPGRPKPSPGVLAERAALREMLHTISPKAIKTLAAALDSSDERNAIRAAEITLSHTVPTLGEVETHDERPLQQLPDAALGEIIARAVSQAPDDGNGGNGAPA